MIDHNKINLFLKKIIRFLKGKVYTLSHYCFYLNISIIFLMNLTFKIYQALNITLSQKWQITIWNAASHNRNVKTNAEFILLQWNQNKYCCVQRVTWLPASGNLISCNLFLLSKIIFFKSKNVQKNLNYLIKPNSPILFTWKIYLMIKIYKW